MLKSIISKAREKINFQKFKEFNFKKHYKFFAGFLILIIAGLILPSGFAHAGIFSSLGDAVMAVLYGVIYLIFYVLFEVAYLVAYIGASVISISLNPAIMNNVFANPAIGDGWRIIRDICNLLFLLIMLMIAFGEIIQSQKYNIKNSLTKLIVAIFLINFSNVIAGAIIDFGNILMFGIIKWMCPSISDSCFQDSYAGLMDVIKDFNVRYALGNVGFDMFTAKDATGMAVATIYTYAYGFILLALAAFLVVRTAALAILIILSPFAYFGDVMPGMEKIASKWWSEIWSYTLFGPIFALMLYISAKLAEETIAIPAVTDPDLAVWGELITEIISNIIPLIFLLAIIPVTKSLGLAGTDMIMKNTTGLGVGVAKYAGGVADRYMARGAQPGHGAFRKALSYVSPGTIKRAWKAKKADSEKDYTHATGQMRNAMDVEGTLKDAWGNRKDLSGNRKNPNYKNQKVDHLQKAKDVAAEEKSKAKGITNVDELIDETEDMINKDIEPELVMKNMRQIATEGGTEKFMKRFKKVKKDENGNSVKDESGNVVMEDAYGKGGEGFSNFLGEKFAKTDAAGKDNKAGYRNLDDVKISRFASDIAKLEKKNGNVEYADIGKYDTSSRKYVFNRMNTDEKRKDQEKAQIEAAKSMDVKDIKSSSIVGRDEKVTSGGEAILREIKGSKLDRIKTWSQGDCEKIDKGLGKKYTALLGCSEENAVEEMLNMGKQLKGINNEQSEFYLSLATTWDRVRTNLGAESVVSPKNKIDNPANTASNSAVVHGGHASGSAYVANGSHSQTNYNASAGGHGSNLGGGSHESSGNFRVNINTGNQNNESNEKATNVNKKSR